jgi:hypothetical protein
LIAIPGRAPVATIAKEPSYSFKRGFRREMRDLDSAKGTASSWSFALWT